MTEEQKTGMIIGFIAFAVIGTIINFFYCRTLHKLVTSIAPEHRSIEPHQVWFQLIPIMHIIYPFIMLPEVIKSVRLEMQSQGQELNGDQGLTSALLYPATRFLSFIPTIGLLFSLISLVFFIIFWVKAGKLTKQITSNSGLNLIDN